jgi:hypothetical protein
VLLQMKEMETGHMPTCIPLPDAKRRRREIEVGGASQGSRDMGSLSLMNGRALCVK